MKSVPDEMEKHAVVHVTLMYRTAVAIYHPTTLALTATATPEVQNDIARQLGLEPDQIRTFNTEIEQPNLHLDVKRQRDHQKLHALLQYAKTEEDRKLFIQRYFGLDG